MFDLGKEFGDVENKKHKKEEKEVCKDLGSQEDRRKKRRMKYSG